MSAIDVDSGTEISIDRAFVTMTADSTEHAAVRLLGTGIRLSDSRVETLSDSSVTPAVTSAWGGLQVRGGSANVQIVGNDIVGGLGHGITLGSVTWNSTDGTVTGRVEGVGRVQTTFVNGILVVTGDLTFEFSDAGLSFTASIDPAIVDLVIADNRIASMGTNGISAITVLGMPSGEPFVEVQNGIIADNSVTGNLVQITDGAVPTRTDVFPKTFSTDETRSNQLPVMQFLPYAGITLAAATLSLDVRGNSVTDNGTSAVSPTSGIFVLVGESLVITDNRITGNGGRADSTTPPAAGVRAGIAVVFADRPFNPSTGSTPTDSVEDIDQLQVLINGDQPTLDQSGPALRVRGNSVLQPEGRALFAIATGPVSVTSNFLSSLGYHGNSDPPESHLMGDVVYIENFARPWESFNFDPSVLPTRYNAPLGQNTSAYFSNVGSSPYQFISFGGAILFQGNQVIYDWLVEIVPPAGTPLSYVPVALISTDHVTMSGNQVALRVRPDAGLTLPEFGTIVTGPPITLTTPAPLLGNIFSGGATNITTDNRSSESPDAAALSFLTWGDLANLSSFNQATHAALAYSWDNFTTPPSGPRQPPNVQTVGNQTVFLLKSPTLASLLADFNTALVVRQLFRQPQRT
jgi:hypothetical protein